MKKKKILITLCAIVLSLVIIVSGFVLNGTCFEKTKASTNEQNRNWMSCIKDETKVSDIVIPGSHDAGTYTLNYLSKTQSYSVSDQLQMGVRYFDLRVRKKNSDYYLYHSIFNGEFLLPALDCIKNFIVTNTSETLLLDFQHFDGGSKTDVFNFIKESLYDSNLCLVNTTSKSDLEFISNVTLSEARGKCIIFFGEDKEFVNNNYIFERNNDESSKTNCSLNSTYISKYNKMNSKKYIETGLPFYIEQIKTKINDEQYKGIFVLQGQLTDGKFIFGPYHRERSHNENMTKYINDLKTSEDLSLINVIMRDFLNEEKCEQIISLNYDKNNVKESKVSEFSYIY